MGHCGVTDFSRRSVSFSRQLDRGGAAYVYMQLVAFHKNAAPNQVPGF